MDLIEALTPPPKAPEGTKARLAELRRLIDEAITVTIPLVTDNGSPLRRDPSQLSVSIDPTQTTATVRHWEKGHAPLVRDIALSAEALAAAKVPVDREKRVIMTEPITLDRGVPATIRLLTPDGRPLAGAWAFVRARPREAKDSDLRWDEAPWLPDGIEADDQGRLRIENISDAFAVVVQVWAPGFLPAARVFEFSADNRPATWTLVPALPVQGRVVDGRTREPIAGARLELSGVFSESDTPRSGWDRLANSRPTLTDAAGRFTLSSIHPEWRGTATVKREGYADLNLGDLAKLAASANTRQPGTAAEYVMRRGHRLAGHLRVPSGFLRDLNLFIIEAEYDEPAPAPPGHRQPVGRLHFWKKAAKTHPLISIDRPEFDPEATDIPFVFPNLPEGRLRLRVFFSTHKLFAETHIDLASDRNDAELTVPAMGNVEVSLVSPAGDVLPVRGRLGYYRTAGKPRGPFASGASSRDQTMPVIAGRATTLLFGESDKQKIVFVDQYLTGYRFIRPPRHGGRSSSQTFDLPANGSPLRISIPVEPAGAFRVRILDDNGHPPPDGEGKVAYQFLGPEYSTSSDDSAPYRQLLFSPVPIRGEYELIVSQGTRIATTGKVTLTPENPVVERVLQFAPGVRFEGKILDAEGRPIAGGKIRLGHQYLAPQPTMLIGSGEQTTGPNGEFAFDGINFDLPNPWWLETLPEADGPPAMPRHRISIDANTANPFTIKLPAVHTTSGRLLDHETGRPVSGIEVAVWLRPGISAEGRPAGWTRHRQSAKPATDANGVFHFSNLIAGAYELHVSTGRIITERLEVKAPPPSTDERKWIDLLRVPETTEEPNVFWHLPTTK